MLDVTCQNDNVDGTGRPCTDKGITKEADTDGSIPIICGACGQQITDIKPAAGQ